MRATVSVLRISFVALCVVSFGARAVEPRAIALRDALSYARTHQPAVRAATARVRALEADRMATFAQWLPYLGSTAQVLVGTSNNTTTSYVGVRGVDIPRIGGTKAGAPVDLMPYPSTLIAAGAQQELFDFGRIGAQTDADDLNVVAERERARATDLDVALGVTDAYFSVAAAHAVVNASDEAYTRALAHRNLAAALVKSELRPTIELTRAETDLTRFDVGRVRARGALSIAQSALAAAVGADDERLDVIADDPDVVAASSSSSVPSSNAARDDVLSHDPAVRAAEARVRAQQAQTRAIEAQSLPNLWLSSTLSARDGGAPVTPPLAAPYGLVPIVPNYDAVLVVSWPLFDGVLGARANASRVREDERKAELALVEQRETAAVLQARESVSIATNAMTALHRAVEAAQANEAQASARFQSGLGTSVEVADAEAARTDAEIQLAIGTFDVARARSHLARLLAEGPETP